MNVCIYIHMNIPFFLGAKPQLEVIRLAFFCHTASIPLILRRTLHHRMHHHL